MAKQCIKLYATGTATADNVASAIVPTSGKITAVDWSALYTTAGAAGGSQIFQISLQSTGQFALNDARNVVSEVAVGAAAAAAVSGIENKYVSLSSGIDVKAGDKIYLHRSTGVLVLGACQINVNLFCA